MLSSEQKIQYSHQIWSIGSCFSVHMSDRLSQLGYLVDSNPTGITFNPKSILHTLKIVLEPNSLQENRLIFHNETYAHLDFHSSYNQLDDNIFMKTAYKNLLKANKSLIKADFIIITLGTCFVFKHNKTKEIVNNCHKLPASAFTPHLMTSNEVLDSLEEIRALVLGQTEKPQIIFSVSPVRHIKNGLVQDRRSKSIALLAAHHMCDNYSDCHYFPSYEIMTDDLRDYRFYKDDLIHPSNQAIEHIFNEFSTTWLAQEEQSLRDKILSIQNRRLHRPRFPDTTAHTKFKDKLEADTKDLITEYPFLAETLV